MMRTRIAAAVVSSIILLGSAMPVKAGADVMTIQMREHGVAVNFTNIPDLLSDEPAETPPGSYFFITVNSGVGEASGHNYPGSSNNTTWISYTEWTVNKKGDWSQIVDWAGAAPDGAAGLDIAENAGWATLRASMPVGYCSEYAAEDAGGDCLDYVWVGTANVDLEWTPTTGLLSGTNTESWGVPSEWQYVSRYGGHYRDASVSGQMTLPGSAPQVVSSPLGTIYLRAIGEMDLYVTRGH